MAQRLPRVRGEFVSYPGFWWFSPPAPSTRLPAGVKMINLFEGRYYGRARGRNNQ
ncbi:hypothetical protein ACVWZY_000162 [Ewingella americana]